MEKRIIRCLCAACALLAFIVAGGCGERGFKVKGEIEGAPDSSVVVEKSDFRTLATDRLDTDISWRQILHIPPLSGRA